MKTATIQYSDAQGNEFPMVLSEMTRADIREFSVFVRAKVLKEAGIVAKDSPELSATIKELVEEVCLDGCMLPGRLAVRAAYTVDGCRELVRIMGRRGCSPTAPISEQALDWLVTEDNFMKTMEAVDAVLPFRQARKGKEANGTTSQTPP